MPTGDAGYLEQLTATDLRTLAEVEPPGAELVPPDNSRVAQLLAHPAVFEWLFGAAGAGEVFAAASPFLVFGVLVHRAAAELERSTFVVERAGERSRLPVFDVGPLRSFVADPARRLFLVELLASYTKVHSGVVWVQSDTGWRRQRFSELDPIRFALLLDSVPAAERPGIFRRLGDIALFLCGVFPDQAQRLLAGPVALRRLHQLSVGLAPAGPAVAAVAGRSPTELLEALGQRWYQLAYRLVPAAQRPAIQVVADLGERFGDARRVLNFMTDRYLFPYRDLWFSKAER